MLVKQKEANRQSRILIQSTGPDAQLLQALEDVARMTRALEEARQEHQDKVSHCLPCLGAFTGRGFCSEGGGAGSREESQ